MYIFLFFLWGHFYIVYDVVNIKKINKFRRHQYNVPKAIILGTELDILTGDVDRRPWTLLLDQGYSPRHISKNSIVNCISVDAVITRAHAMFR